jgi:hypothetical protein
MDFEHIDPPRPSIFSKYKKIILPAVGAAVAVAPAVAAAGVTYLKSKKNPISEEIQENENAGNIDLIKTINSFSFSENKNAIIAGGALILFILLIYHMERKHKKGKKSIISEIISPSPENT